MATIRMFKMPFATTHFNANQRVFVAYMTGDCAAYCVGKFRGKGRYVKAWVTWAAANKPAPAFKTFDVADAFAQRHGLESPQ